MVTPGQQPQTWRRGNGKHRCLSTRSRSVKRVQKQFKYADKRGVPYVILLGEQELTDGKFVAKNMKTGDQKDYPVDSPQEFAEKIKSDF